MYVVVVLLCKTEEILVVRLRAAVRVKCRFSVLSLIEAMVVNPVCTDIQKAVSPVQVSVEYPYGQAPVVKIRMSR